MNESIMPLVEENRRLHDEVRALKSALAEQNVRVDQMLSSGNCKHLIRYLDVEVQHASFLREPGWASELSRDLAAKLLLEMPRIAQQVAPRDLTLTYRFAFLGVGK